jgi:hypothetical protein
MNKFKGLNLSQNHINSSLALSVLKDTSGFGIGDIIVSAREPSDPEWIKTDGASYLKTSYPDLALLLPPVLFNPGVKLANPEDLPTGTGRGTSFSPNADYLSVAQSASPFLTIYKKSGDTFTKLPNPSVLPTGFGYGTSL